MKNVFKFAVVLALALAIVGAYGVFNNAKASAASASSVLGGYHTPLTAGAATVLKKARFVQGFSGASLPVGTFTTIDSTTLVCPGTSGSCTYRGDNAVQINASATSNWAIITEVDGNFIGVGPYLGPVGTDFTANSWRDSLNGISFGTHTVSTVVFMRDNPATADWYHFAYEVYKP